MLQPLHIPIKQTFRRTVNIIGLPSAITRHRANHGDRTMATGLLKSANNTFKPKGRRQSIDINGPSKQRRGGLAGELIRQITMSDQHDVMDLPCEGNIKLMLDALLINEISALLDEQADRRMASLKI